MSLVTAETHVATNPIAELDMVRHRIREELEKGENFSIRAKFSGGLCLCGETILEGEQITVTPLWNRWIHKKCADLEKDPDRPISNAAKLTNKIIEQTNNREAAWKPDLIDLAKLSFLGKWSVDQWIEDQIITTKILDLYGLHRLTTGYQLGSDKMMKKYAQKIEKEFAKRRGWICRRCKRLIWVQESVERGIGPVCNKHSMSYENQKEIRRRIP